MAAVSGLKGQKEQLAVFTNVGEGSQVIIALCDLTAGWFPELCTFWKAKQANEVKGELFSS